jgi:ElaB/YqjD/DUF883 family membrane-anchored ribosome-binding protein
MPAMIMTAHPRTVAQKRDLHVGGLGASASGALAAISDPMVESSEDLIGRARDLLHDADELVRDNPWPAIGIVALLSLAAGFLLGRR